MSIFKANDIRGVYPNELNEDMFYKIARAFATFSNAKRIIVGGDNRLSTPSLKDSFIRGLLDSGVDVTDVGVVPTSTIYFACYKLGFDAGAMITASHNPKEFNGIKMCDSEGLAIGLSSGLEKIKEIIEKSQFKTGKGQLHTADILEEYAKFVIGIANNFKGIRIVVDGSNGSAGQPYVKILRSLGADVIELFCEPDGNFPNHKIPDPLIEENLKEIKEEVKKRNADIGFALDGDGDRLIVINDKGEKANTNHITALLSELCLSQNKNAKIVYDIVSSQLVGEVIKENGGVPVIWKVGHSKISRKCKEIDAPFAGEASSHYYFKESSYTDDTLIAAIKLLDILVSKKKKLSEITEKYPSYYQVIEKRVSIPENVKFQFIENLEKEFIKKEYEIDTLDGVKIKFENGWALFRASNTESKIVISYESPNLQKFNEIEDFVTEIIKTIPNEIKIIIFDLERVLMGTWRDLFDLPEFHSIPKTPIVVFFDDYNQLRKELQYGRVSEDEFWRQFIDATHINQGIDFFKKAVRKILVLDSQMMDLAKSLKSNYKVILLSNFTKEWAEYLISKYKLNEIFDDMFWSFQSGIKKPTPEAYLQITKKFNIRPEECIFIDDRERNIEGAKNIGMKTILYTNPEELKKSLSEMEIKVGG